MEDSDGRQECDGVGSFGHVRQEDVDRRRVVEGNGVWRTATACRIMMATGGLVTFGGQYDGGARRRPMDGDGVRWTAAACGARTVQVW